MRRRAAAPAISLAVLAGAGALWLAQPAGACGCGVAIEATVHDESALVIEEPGRERIVMSLELESEGDQRAAVVLPVPGVPTVEAVKHGDPIAYLDVATKPPPTAAASGGGGETASARPVDVLGRDTVGGYDVARLGAGDAAALNEWLDANGYTLPPGAGPILDDYVADGWHFVAIRLAPQSNGRLKPLDVGFATDEYVYPMKLEQLASVPLNLTLFALADGARQVDGLQTVWDGGVGELSPQPPPQLEDMFATGYVTRMQTLNADPAGFTEDLTIEPADEGTVPADEASTSTTASASSEQVDTADDSGVSTAGVVALIAAGLAFAVGIALITRPRRD